MDGGTFTPTSMQEMDTSGLDYPVVADIGHNVMWPSRYATVDTAVFFLSNLNGAPGSHPENPFPRILIRIRETGKRTCYLKKMKHGWRRSLATTKYGRTNTHLSIRNEISPEQ